MAELQQQHAELQQQYYAVLDERNRLASRVEQLCRELEKNKTAGDQSMDRVMQANARLLEEKDRLPSYRAWVAEREQTLRRILVGAEGAASVGKSNATMDSRNAVFVSMGSLTNDIGQSNDKDAQAREAAA